MTQIPPKVHSSRFVELAQAAKNRIREITVQELKEKLANNQRFYLIDVREESEFANGCIPTALHLSKGVIERDIEKYIANADAEIVVYCSGGYRSALVADSLQKMGYSNVASVSGGLTAWLNEGSAIQPTKQD